VITEWELWAVAEYLAKREGQRAEVFVWERIDALTRLNDAAGVAAWRAIEVRLIELRRPNA
jgi:hypothetical protein